MSYSRNQAAGLTAVEAIPNPIELWAGHQKVDTTPMQAASGVSFAQFEVFSVNSAGEAVKFVPGTNVAKGVAAQATTAAGGKFPAYIGGTFNHAALVWPAGTAADTLGERKALLIGSPIGVEMVL